MNRDSSFYLDTRLLRQWISAHLKGKTVLNTFAYTGSLGIAALVAGATEVTQLDLNRHFLQVAKQSAGLNGRKVDVSFYQIADFWSRINQYKNAGRLFDCVILDPPVYAKTDKGTIDIAKNYNKIINKVRPIIADGGTLITISNALFQSGQDHHSDLLALCEHGYLNLQEIIPVPIDCVGNSGDLATYLPADPAPYNYATKISVLGVKRKAAGTSSTNQLASNNTARIEIPPYSKPS